MWYICNLHVCEQTHSGWVPGQPTGSAGVEDCGVFTHQGQMEDEPCTREKPFICEQNRPSTTTASTTRKVTPAPRPEATVPSTSTSDPKDNGRY